MPFPIVAESQENLKKALGCLRESIQKIEQFRGEITLVVDASRILEICQTLKTHTDLQFNFLADLTAVDHLNEMQPGDPRFHVVYQLFSTVSKRRVRLKAPVWDEKPEIESVTPVWKAANWHERECYDMFGIRFLNHPELRRILMPDDWEGHPLRKDFPVNDQEPYEYIKKQLADE